MNKLKQTIYTMMTGYCPSKGEFILLGCAFTVGLPFILIHRGMKWLWNEWYAFALVYCDARAKKEGK